jgi:hypothetical protein
VEFRRDATPQQQISATRFEISLKCHQHTNSRAAHHQESRKCVKNNVLFPEEKHAMPVFEQNEDATYQTPVNDASTRN